jgi:C4-dicarboxylate-specific signal transduction histidine kinase
VTLRITSGDGQVREDRTALTHALRLTAMGELVASLSHEVSQPLAGILMVAEATRRSLERSEASLQETLAALDDIIADTRRAAQVIRSVRAFLRGDDGERGPVDVNRLIGETVRFVQREAIRSLVGLRMALDPGLPAISADAVQIQQVLVNVLVNAVEATARVPEPREVRVESGQREPGVLWVHVTDTGAGLDPEMLDKVFEPFVTTKADGLGMGLSISRSIVQAHGGTIRATRNPDRGLTIHIELPCRADDGREVG